MNAQGSLVSLIIGGLIVAVGILGYLFYQSNQQQQGIEIKVSPSGASINPAN